MQCTAEEIAEKKREALDRLKRLKQCKQPNEHSSGAAGSNLATDTQIAEKRRQALERLKHRTRPNEESPLPKAGNQSTVTQIKPTMSFYGVTPSSKANELNEYEHKLKHSADHFISNRILSQPYPSRQSIASPAETTKMANIFTTVVTCSCSMVSAMRFEVKTVGFLEQLINVFKTVPSRSYDNETKTWTFGLEHYDLVQEKVGCLSPQVTIGKIPKFAIDLLKSDDVEIDFSCLQAIEKNLASQLLEFQKYGVSFGVSRKGRCLIADDMGLGKTFQALAIADFYRDDWPLLIVTTATARSAWERHIRDLLPSVSAQHISCLASTSDFVRDSKVLITSYQMMERNCDRLLQNNFGFIILDESHTVKNFKAKVTQSATRLCGSARRVVLLSGTPALSRPAELYCQLALIDKRFFGSFKEFSVRYCAGTQTQFGLNSSGQSNLKELNAILKRKFMIRRTKADVEFELGEKSRETILLDAKKIWERNTDDMKATIENCTQYANDYQRLKGNHREEVLLRLYAETAKLKAAAVCSYLKGLLKNKQKFIVFAFHQVMLNSISASLEKLCVDYIRIDGSTRKDLRSTYIDRFQSQDKCKVAVLSLKACNAAITLTAASLVIFAELDWNPSTLAQCEARAHRIGQKSPVICRYLLAKGTADDYIWEMVKRKQEVLNKAGIFSEDLSDATHSVAPSTASQKIPDYFNQSSSHLQSDINENDEKENDKEEEMECDLNDSYKQMLDNDDDDAFMLDIDC